MAYDVKKECKELYAPKKGPSIVEVPPMSFVAVRGSGDPNEENGAYQRAIAILYAISYTIKMSKKAPAGSTATLTSSCRPLRVSGGRTGSRAPTTPTRRPSTGSRSSACRTS